LQAGARQKPAVPLVSVSPNYADTHTKGKEGAMDEQGATQEPAQEPEHAEAGALRREFKMVDAVRIRLEEHLRSRDGDLAVCELTLLDRVARQEITLLNPMTRKLHMEFMALMHSTMQLECKMARRGIFYLRSRHRALGVRLTDLARRAEAIGVMLERRVSGEAKKETI